MTDLLLIGGATPKMLQRLEQAFTIHHLADMTDPKAWVAENGARIHYVATNGHDGIKADYMAAMPNLKAISCYGVGYDAIDTTMARARGVVVTHTPNVLNAEVASTALMLMLACYRNLLADDAHVRSGAWERDGNAPLSRSADNQVVGIVGLGRIGQAIADKLGALNATILYHSRSQKMVPYQYCESLVDMAQASNVLICITPGGDETKKLINAEVLNALGPQGTLINVSRGSVVDETALIEALQQGRLGWAGLDVFEQEPKVPAALREMPNVVLLPHVGSATHETRAAMGDLTVENLLQHLEHGTVISPVPECAGM